MIQPLTYYKAVAHHFLGDKCSQCGSTKHLILHHKDFNRENNKPQNLQLLCTLCHRKLHSEKTLFPIESEKGSTSIKMPNRILILVQRIVENNPWWEDPETFIISAVRNQVHRYYPSKEAP